MHIGSAAVCQSRLVWFWGSIPVGDLRGMAERGKAAKPPARAEQFWVSDGEIPRAVTNRGGKMKTSSIPWKTRLHLFLFLTAAEAGSDPAEGQLAAVPAPVGIVMQRDWDSPVQEGDLTVDELYHELSRFGQAARNLGPAPELDIYRGVRYLMPLRQALKALQITVHVSGKHMVICPGLPHRTLYAYSFSYLEEPGFNEIHIVADKADQVVAIQLYAAQGKNVPERNLPKNRKFRVYDFINSRAKALTTAEVGHRTNGRDVIQLDSDFRDPTGGVYRLTRLFLPKPLVELALFRIEKIKARAGSN